MPYAIAEDRIICGVTDVTFSRTGRLMFAGYEENFCVAWETSSKDGYVIVCVCVGGGGGGGVA